MNILKIPNIRPRNGETHGLFGVRFLKHHKMRDEQWTADDLIQQYERLSFIFEKDNEVKKLQKRGNEELLAEKYGILKKAYKDKIEDLKSLIEGDIQRTKNILLNFPDYLRVYYNKRSEEVLDELDCKTFTMRKSLDRCVNERSRLIKEYEKRLLDVSKFQEMICYYDIKEFQQERDTKRLYVDLKNSKTRIQTIEKINMTFKMIIDQMLHDSLYYLPVLEAVNADWKEQTTLVQQTYNIGYPAINHAKKTERDVIKLSELSKIEEAQRFEELLKNRQNLKEYPKQIKELVRRDSDFTGLNDRYLRDTISMTKMRRTFEKLEPGINKLMNCTLTPEPEEIISGANYMMTMLNNKLDVATNGKNVWNFLIDQSVIVEFVHDMLLDDDVKLYDEEYFKEFISLKKAIQVEKDKQSIHNQIIIDRAELSRLLAFSCQHMVDVLRHVGTKKVYKNIEYPEGRLKIHLFRFFKHIPMKPKYLQTDLTKLLNLIKTKVLILNQFYKKKKEMGVDFTKAVSVFQKAVVEDSNNTFRPRAESSFDFD